jgi:diaminopimelate epimerase
MGQAQVGAERQLEIGGRDLIVTPVSLGNPHCVILTDDAAADEARALGPCIERHPEFPNRTNVQFVQVVSRARLRIEIWERGSGYTLASGSSACAAAAVVRQRGLCDASVTVEMSGGELQVDIAADGAIRQSGPVMWVAWGKLQLAPGTR